jgi:hypothetical protein
VGAPLPLCSSGALALAQGCLSCMLAGDRYFRVAVLLAAQENHGCQATHGGVAGVGAIGRRLVLLHPWADSASVAKPGS